MSDLINIKTLKFFNLLQIHIQLFINYYSYQLNEFYILKLIIVQILTNLILDS